MYVKYAALVCCVSVGVYCRMSLFDERSSRDSSEHYRVTVNAGIHNHTPALSLLCVSMCIICIIEF